MNFDGTKEVNRKCLEKIGRLLLFLVAGLTKNKQRYIIVLNRTICLLYTSDQLNEILLNLERSLVDNQQMVFVRRNLRIYQREKIFIVKPVQRKYWTYSAACRDADEIFEDISKAWR